MKIDQAFVDAATASFKEMLTRAMQDGADINIDIRKGSRKARNPSQLEWQEWEYSGDDSIHISLRSLPKHGRTKP